MILYLALMSHFSKSSQAWKERLKHWTYTCTFVAFSTLIIMLCNNSSTSGVISVGGFLQRSTQPHETRPLQRATHHIKGTHLIDPVGKCKQANEF